MNRLAIVGASGHGRVVADTAELCGWDQIEFFDDCWPQRKANGAWDIVGCSSSLLDRLAEYNGVVVAIGDNNVRLDLQSRLQAAGAILVTTVHPAAFVSRHSTLGAGSVVFAGAVVNAGARIGAGAILNTGCSVDHDCVLGDFVHISPGARLAGNVRVGSRSWFGIGAVARQGVNVGSDVMVGAGAVVIGDVADGLKIVGVPAKPIAR